MPQHITQKITGASDKFIGKIYKALDECRTLDVSTQEKSMKFGTDPTNSNWLDCECDEVDLRKEIHPETPATSKKTCAMGAMGRFA